MINTFRKEQLTYANKQAKYVSVTSARDYLLFCGWTIDAVDFLYPIN